MSARYPRLCLFVRMRICFWILLTLHHVMIIMRRIMRMRRKITRSGGRQRRGGAKRVLIRCAWRRSLHWNMRVIGRQSLDQNWLYLQSYYHRSPFCFDDAGDFCVDHLVDKEVSVDSCQGERTRDAQRSWSPAIVIIIAIYYHDYIIIIHHYHYIKTDVLNNHDLMDILIVLVL